MCDVYYKGFIADSCGTVIDCFEGNTATLCIKEGYNNNSRLCVNKFRENSVIVRGLNDNNTPIIGYIARYTFGEKGFICRPVHLNGCVLSK